MVDSWAGRVRKKAAALAVMFVVLLAIALAYGTSKGYTVWYVYVPQSRITVDGRQVPGWVHRARGDDLVILTFKESGRRESYLAYSHANSGDAIKCVDWTAPRFPILMMNHQDLPCSLFAKMIVATKSFSSRSRRQDYIYGPNFVEFSADDGERVRAEW